jgi:hypothetical protein
MTHYWLTIWRVTTVALVITIVGILSFVNFNVHADLRALIVLDAPIFLLMKAVSDWPSWAAWTVSGLAEFIWVWCCTFVAWRLARRGSRTDGI